MKVTVLKPAGGEPIFLRKLEGDSTMAGVTQFAMTQEPGTEFEILVSNKGFDLSFKTGPICVEDLVRRTEGIMAKKVKSAEATVAEASS